MFGSWKKVKYDVSFTIHYLRLAESCSDSFQVEWKRGDFSGLTERGYCSSNNEVFFEKSYKCQATLYISKRANEPRAKLIKFKVFRFANQNKSKSYGILNFDISPFWKFTSKKVCIYPIEGTKAFLALSLILSEIGIDPSQNRRDSDLSMTDSYQPPEKEIIEPPLEIAEPIIEPVNPPNTIEAISQLPPPPPPSEEPQPFIRIDKKQRLRSWSSEFFKSEDIEEAIGTQDSGNKSPQLKPIPSFAAPKNAKSQKLFPSFDQLLSSHNSSNSSLISPSDSNDADSLYFNFALFDEEGPTVEPAEAIDSIKKVFQRTWVSHPLKTRHIPKICSAILATMINFKVFRSKSYDNLSFNAVISAFFDEYIESNVIKDGTYLDRWIVSLYLIILFEHTKKADTDRVELFNNRLKEIASKQIVLFLQKLTEKPISIGKEIIQQPNSYDLLMPSLIDSLYSIDQMITAPTIIEYIKKLAFEEFDAQMVNLLVSTPHVLCFGNAIVWNSFITQFESQFSGELKLFRQAVLVLMMASELCANPKKVTEMCPLLPISTVLRLLISQQPDDMMPLTNNVEMFIKEFSHDTQIVPQTLHSQSIDQFQLVEKSFKGGKWRETKFSKKEMDGFEYFSKFFAESQ